MESRSVSCTVMKLMRVVVCEVSFIVMEVILGANMRYSCDMSCNIVSLDFF